MNAPTPFTAGEIRAGCPDGRTITLLVEPAGGEPFRRVNRYRDGDADGVTVDRWTLGPDGAPAGEVEATRSTWLELQAHASFPEEVTTVTRETVTLPLGEVETLRYRVGTGADAATFWFAPAHPGMPVRYESPSATGGVDRTTVESDRMS
ncbi:hypothetical protein [Intrasporangium flavum]|uniref:hypothetical protein n=1 Tax=Intrasporangium flavum TaxID=1428657 RepID=UPI00096F126A|nr:hypothetical protein [Intrasporangium flavum]